MNDVAVTTLLNGGGVLVFAFMIWRSQDLIKAAIEKKADEAKASAERKADELRGAIKEATDEVRDEAKAIHECLTRLIERLARIDDRTYRAQTAEAVPTETMAPVRPYRTRVKTPAPITRTKAQTPFMGEGEK